MSAPSAPTLARAAGVEVDTGRRVRAFVELGKPRVVLMVLVTTFVGFDLAGGPVGTVLWHTLLSTALAASGTLALNQYLERDLDGLMLRTRHRPVPSGVLRPDEALAFGVIVTAAGLVYQTLLVGSLAALVTAATTVTYLFLYTPMKRTTPLCSVVGAISGALPPVTGWAAARGEIGIEAGVLFTILYLWQFPHSLAIARLYREDYARAGIRLLPVIDPDGPSTGRQIVANSLALLSVALLPTLVGLSGRIYFACALVLGLALLEASVRLARTRSLADAKRLLYASLLYLPLLLGVMTVDRAG
jgi:protoheme IX farnesyltransferase